MVTLRGLRDPTGSTYESNRLNLEIQQAHLRNPTNSTKELIWVYLGIIQAKIGYATGSTNQSARLVQRVVS